MKESTKKYISMMAESVGAAYKLISGKEVPIDMYKLVSFFGGSITAEAWFDRFYDGAVMKTGEYSFVIRTSTATAGRNFEIARAFGHIVLHMGFISDHEFWEKQPGNQFIAFNSDEQREQANEFAYDLLMPEKEYRKIVSDNSFGDKIFMSHVADYFNVSESIAIKRGMDLNIVAYNYLN